jgi:hypothetical protein
VVLDGEQDEAVRVLLKYGLACLLLLESGCNLCLFCGRVGHHRDALNGNGDLVGLVAAVKSVLLVGLRAEQGLLGGGIHLEALNGRCGLQRGVSYRVSRFSV